MRIIFLDVDGVLINHASFRPPLKVAGEPAKPDPSCVEALNFITSSVPDVAIVVSSSHRIGRSNAAMREICRSWGIQALVLGSTPSVYKSSDFNGKQVSVRADRGAEIQEWLDDYSDRLCVDAFVILDDETDMLHLLPRLVKTEMGTGLTMADAKRAIELLTTKEHSDANAN